MSTDEQCFFCNGKCEIYDVPDRYRDKHFECKSCGDYLLAKKFPLFDQSADIDEKTLKFKIACVLNERRLKGLSGIALSRKTDKEKIVCGYPQISIDDILSEFPKKASEYLNKTLLNLSRLTENPFGIIGLNMQSDMPNNACLHFFIQRNDGCKAFLRELKGQGYIRPIEGRSSNIFSLTAKFWDVIENLQHSEIDSKRVFVAMWFDSSMDELYKEGIKPAIEDAGYTPIKIDGEDFNGKICDEIISEIKRSKFVVADFCGQRGGVYFEAGYAMGHGKPVIFTASETELSKLHFDTRQYNHIGYDTPEDLRKKLFNRICATIK